MTELCLLRGDTSINLRHRTNKEMSMTQFLVHQSQRISGHVLTERSIHDYGKHTDYVDPKDLA